MQRHISLYSSTPAQAAAVLRSLSVVRCALLSEAVLSLVSLAVVLSLALSVTVLSLILLVAVLQLFSYVAALNKRKVTLSSCCWACPFFYWASLKHLRIRVNKSHVGL